MNKIILPIDTKSLYFNIKNDNSLGHTPTVATPLRKVVSEGYKLEDILKIKEKEVDISDKIDLIDILVKHSKSKVLIRHLYVFDKLSVNGIPFHSNNSFGCYIKEEVDETKVQFGRLKLHYPSKLNYNDIDINVNNKNVYNSISKTLNDYAFIIRGFEYNELTEVLDFDALIVGENNIPYSKVFINLKGVGNKFNLIFNENADDYDREVIYLRKHYGGVVTPYNYLNYIHLMKLKAIDLIKEKLKTNIEVISLNFPYSLFDFIYLENGVKKYGILRVSSTRSVYFNLSSMQQSFMYQNKDNVNIFMVSEIFETCKLHIIDFDNLVKMNKSINSIKYEGEN